MYWNFSRRKWEIPPSANQPRVPETPNSRDVNFLGNHVIFLSTSDLPYTKYWLSLNNSLILLSNVPVLVAVLCCFDRLALLTGWQDYFSFWSLKVSNFFALHNSKSLRGRKQNILKQFPFPYSFFIPTFLEMFETDINAFESLN